MNISRSGYYKWLNSKDKLNQYEINRKNLEPLIRDIHKRKPSYGYPVYGGYYPYYPAPGYYSVSSYNYGGYPIQQPYSN